MQVEGNAAVICFLSVVSHYSPTSACTMGFPIVFFRNKLQNRRNTCFRPTVMNTFGKLMCLPTSSEHFKENTCFVLLYYLRKPKGKHVFCANKADNLRKNHCCCANSGGKHMFLRSNIAKSFRKLMTLPTGSDKLRKTCYFCTISYRNVRKTRISCTTNANTLGNTNVVAQTAAQSC